jgi:hypothetical protein
MPDWSKRVKDNFKDRLSQLGVSPSDIQWSGFWSQGDGASWAGSIIDWTRFNEAVPWKEYPYISKAINAVALDGHVIIRQSRYCHEYTMQCDIEPDYGESIALFANEAKYLDPFKDALYNMFIDNLEKELKGYEKLVLDWARQEARELYNQLEQAYELNQEGE